MMKSPFVAVLRAATFAAFPAITPAARERACTAKRERGGRNEEKDGGRAVSWLARKRLPLAGAGKKPR